MKNSHPQNDEDEFRTRAASDEADGGMPGDATFIAPVADADPEASQKTCVPDGDTDIDDSAEQADAASVPRRVSSSVETDAGAANLETFITSDDDAATDHTFIGDADPESVDDEQLIANRIQSSGEAGGKGAKKGQSKQRKDEAPNIIGTCIGEYEVIGELGRGGMGVVYKARHTKLRRVVALKMILHGQHTTRQQMDRFLIEARAVAALQHPNIVQIFDIGEHEGLPWFTLEFIDGQDLSDVLKGTPQTPEQCADMVETLSRAMQYAHDRGIIHRDLKPANVLVSKDGTPKITDFGLAKELEDEDSSRTRTGTIMGSPSYMSPEQASGRVEDVGAPSDQYSLGAVLYQMMTARAPFASAKALDTITQVVNNDPLPPRRLQPEVPIDLETICLKTLQKDPAARYENCQALADDLRRFINREPILARPISRLESAWKWCKRNPKIAIPSLASVGLLVLTAVISLWAYTAVAAQNVQIEEEKTKAEQQKDIADANALLAQENEKIARTQADLTLKNLQAFINKIDTKLASKSELRPLRLEILEEVSIAWNAIDEGVRNDKLGEAIPTRMGARFRLAQIFQQAGELTKAYAEAEKLYAIGNERIELKQWTDSTRLNQARIKLVLMGPLRRQIDRDQAETLKQYEEAVRLCRDIVANPKPGDDKNGPGRTMVRAVLSEGLQRVGVSHLFEGNLPAAREAFAESRLIRDLDLQALQESDDFKKLSDEDKAKQLIEPQKVLDLSSMALAYTLLRQERPDEAVKLYEEAWQGRMAAAKQHPDNQDLKLVYAGTCGNLGVAWHWMNQLKKAKELLETSVTASRELYEIDPGNSVFKRRYATALYRLGAVQFDLNELDDAKKSFDTCRPLRAELAATGGSEFKQHYMLVLARCGEVAEAEQQAKELGETDKPDADLHLERARTLAQLVRQANDENRPTALTTAFAALNRCIDDGYSDSYKVRVEPDLKPLRDDPRFSEAIQRIETRNAEKTAKK